MAGTVTANLTTISLCEATTGWTATGGTNALNDPTVFDAKQGSYCLQNYSASAVNRGSDYDFGVNTDLSDTVLYTWFAFSKVPHATNYMRIRVTDAAGNWGEWNIFNKAALPHLSWICWAVKTTVTFDATGGTNPTMTQIRKVGWRMDAVVAKVYIYWDAWRYGTGLSIKGGTSGSPAVLEDFYTADSDSNNAYGVIEKYNGVYFVQGKIIIGSTTAGDSTYFQDKNQSVVFKSIKGNPTGFYDIKGQGNSTGTTKIFFGEKAGGAGISGLFINAPSAMKWKLTMSDTYITEFGFYGCSFQNADTIQGQTYSTLKEFLNTSFTAGAEMLPDTGIVKNCTFISAPGRAIRMSSTSHHITDCNFINCVYGVHVPLSDSITFDDLKFAGSDGSTKWDIEHSVSGTLTVNCTNGSNPQYVKESGGGSTQINNAVYLNVYVKDRSNSPISYAQSAIYKVSDDTQLMNKDSDTNGLAQESFNYPGSDVPIYWRVRKSSEGATRYTPAGGTGTITSAGFSVTVTLYEEPLA